MPEAWDPFASLAKFMRKGYEWSILQPRTLRLELEFMELLVNAAEFD